MSDTFDGLPGLDGTVTSVDVLDLDGNPNHIIDDGLPFVVKAAWQVGPPATAALLDGTWTVKAYADSIGPGPEQGIGVATVTANGGPTYAASITVPVGTLPADTGPDSGVYALVVVITYRNRAGVLTELAGFGEGKLFMLRHP